MLADLRESEHGVQMIKSSDLFFSSLPREISSGVLCSNFEWMILYEVVTFRMSSFCAVRQVTRDLSITAVYQEMMRSFALLLSFFCGHPANYLVECAAETSESSMEPYHVIDFAMEEPVEDAMEARRKFDESKASRMNLVAMPLAETYDTRNNIAPTQLVAVRTRALPLIATCCMFQQQRKCA